MSAAMARELVKIVEKYPCLYNTHLADYSTKDVSDKAWSEVAKQMKCSVHDCKDKWKNVRNGFVRSLKPAASGTQKKQYYLYNEMKFVVPYLRPVFNSEDGQSALNYTLPIEFDSPQSVEWVDAGNSIGLENGSEVDSEDEGLQIKKAKLTVKAEHNEDETSVERQKNTHPQSDEDDHRKMFLLSLLSDVHKLTDDQMAAFRIKVLLLLEETKRQSGPITMSLLGK